MGFSSALSMIQGRRPIANPNPGFVRQLRDYESRIKLDSYQNRDYSTGIYSVKPLEYSRFDRRFGYDNDQNEHSKLSDYRNSSYKDLALSKSVLDNHSSHRRFFNLSLDKDSFKNAITASSLFDRSYSPSRLKASQTLYPKQADNYSSIEDFRRTIRELSPQRSRLGEGSHKYSITLSPSRIKLSDFPKKASIDYRPKESSLYRGKDYSHLDKYRPRSQYTY